MIDTAKAVAGARGRRCAAVPTTLSGAELTPFHRMPAGVEGARLVRPALVVADPDLMASQQPASSAASALNALAHALEATYTPFANPVGDAAALRARPCSPRAWAADPPDRDAAALGALLAGYASGAAGFAVHHAVCQTIGAGGRHAARRDERRDAPAQPRLMARRAPAALGAFAAALGAPAADPSAAPERAGRAHAPDRLHAAVGAGRGGGARGRRGRGGGGASRAGQHAGPAGEAELPAFVRAALSSRVGSLAMAGPLEGKVAVATGASSGIGEATAGPGGRRRRGGGGGAPQGAPRRAGRADLGEGGTASCSRRRLTDEADARAFIQEWHDKLGGLDILVDNAGVMLLGPVAGAETAEWRQMIDVNLLGLLWCTHAAFPLMAPSGGGDIGNVSSVAGRRATAGAAVCNMTKFGVHAFSEALPRRRCTPRCE